MSKGVVTVAPAGQAYTFLGNEVLPCDLESGRITGPAVLPGEAQDPSVAVQHAAPQTSVAAKKFATLIDSIGGRADETRRAFGPREVVKAARGRIKQIKAELKQHAALKRELAELERLVSAATKPVAVVRDIRRSG